jgi:hypothetical protein
VTSRPTVGGGVNQPVTVHFDSAGNHRLHRGRFRRAGNLIVSTAGGGLWRWNVSLPAMLHRACGIAGRNLTFQEWADLHTGRPYILACS